MPRPVTIQVYTFDELSEAGKEAAREWWRRCNADSPAWEYETRQSLKAAQRWLQDFADPDDARREADAIIASKDDYPLTGYCMDGTALRIIAKSDAETMDDMQRDLCDSMEKAWEKELEEQNTDESVDENIIANEYSFTIDGKRFDA